MLFDTYIPFLREESAGIYQVVSARVRKGRYEMGVSL